MFPIRMWPTICSSPCVSRNADSSPKGVLGVARPVYLLCVSVVGFGPLVRAVWIEQDLAGFAGLQPLHALAEVLHRQPIGDHGMQVEFARLE